MTETFETAFRSLDPACMLVPSDAGARLVAVVFTGLCDVPAGADAAAAVLRSMIETLLRYEGKIERFQGTGLFVIFGAPRSHEDDPERAVLSALAFRDSAASRGLAVASGVMVGRLTSGFMGLDEHHETTALDPVALLAAHLEARARPGEILVGEAAWRRVQASFEGVPRSFQLGAAGRTVRAWRIERARDRLTKSYGLAGRRAALVGREEEMATLERCWTEARAGTGRLVSIVGEAGVGKSRLVSELRQRAADAPLWLEGRCMELAAGTAFWPFIEILGRHEALAREECGRVDGRQARAFLDGLVQQGALTAQRAQEVGPLFGRLMSVKYGSEWDDALSHASPEQIRHQSCLAIHDLLVAIARLQPLVVVLEDLHWADQPSNDVITRVAESLPSAPILLLCVYRPDGSETCTRLPAVAARIGPGVSANVTLHELSAAESRRLVDLLLPDQSLPPAVRESIVMRSQGNPLFVEEVIRSLVDAGVIFRDGDRWRAGEGASEAPVPMTLQSVVLARVDRLEAPTKRALEAASVFGGAFTSALLERVLPEEQSISQRLSLLEDRALLECARSGEYSFRHVLTQQAVYQGIARRRRARMHEMVAQALESLVAGDGADRCDQLAYHHERAGNTERAIDYLLQAGAGAEAVFMNEVALRRFGRVLDLLPPAAGPDRRRLEALVESGKVHEVTGDHEQAVSELQEAGRLARELGSTPREIARIEFLRCKAITSRRDPDEYLPIAEQIRDSLAGDPGSMEAVLGEMVLALGRFLGRGDVEAVREFAARFGAAYRALPYSRDLAINAGYLAWVAFLARDDGAALEWLDWVEDTANRHHDALGVGAARIRRGRDMLAARGELGGAIEEIEEGCSIYHKAGARYLEALARLSEGDVFHRFGRLEDAERCLEAARPICAELDREAHLAAEESMLRGRLALGRGDSRGALAAFRRALGLAPGGVWGSTLKLLAAGALEGQGRSEEAAHAYSELLRSASGFRVPPAYSTVITPLHLMALVDRCAARSSGVSGVPAASEGLVLSAPTGRGLRGANVSAPRMLREWAGGRAIQAACAPADAGTPGAGGLLVWLGERDYLRLDVGSLGASQVCFSACRRGEDLVIGRCRAPGTPTLLRLELGGLTVRARCSADGTAWQEVGSADLPDTGSPSLAGGADVGLFVDGAVLPEVYPEAFARGSAVRFTGFAVERGPRGAGPGARTAIAST